MKKLLRTKAMLVLAGFSLLALSCTEEHYYNNGGETEPSAYWSNYAIDVSQDQWRWDANRECYFYEVTPSPAWLTEYIAKNGIVQALIKAEDNGYTTFYPLTYVAHYYQQTGPDSGYFYTETISYEFDTNYLRFNVAASDLYDNTDASYLPQSYHFQVRLVW
ncbi:MAG: hypothetical protein LBR34_00660 [Prevotella sp.]|nr:hypothetical protein [Prevotella sp.]